MPHFFPLLMHRWFANVGSGWAYHPDLDSVYGVRATAIEHLDKELIRREPGPFRIDCGKGKGVLLGLRRPDDACSDSQASDRNPYVVVAAYLATPVGDEMEWQVEKALEQLPPMEVSGASRVMSLLVHYSFFVYVVEL
jgi:hypothetical protein